MNNLVSVILISDSNKADVQSLLNSIGRSHLDCQAIVSNSCSETIGAIEQNHPDLLIIDIDHCRVKNADGFDVIRFIRNHDYFSNLPIIIITSSHDSYDINEAFKLRVTGYLVKPQSDKELDELMGFVKDYCDRTQSSKQSHLKRIRELTLQLDGAKHDSIIH